MSATSISNGVAYPAASGRQRHRSSPVTRSKGARESSKSSPSSVKSKSSKQTLQTSLEKVIKQLKGKKEPTGIYECFDGDLPDIVQKKIDSYRQFDEGMKMKMTTDDQEMRMATESMDAVQEKQGEKQGDEW